MDVWSWGVKMAKKAVSYLKGGVKSMKLVQVKELYIKCSVGQVLKCSVVHRGIIYSENAPLKFSFYTKKSLPNEDCRRWHARHKWSAIIAWHTGAGERQSTQNSGSLACQSTPDVKYSSEGWYNLLCLWVWCPRATALITYLLAHRRGIKQPPSNIRRRNSARRSQRTTFA